VKNKNKALKLEEVVDIRIWKSHEPKDMVRKLGFIDPYTGMVLDPDTFCFDRILDSDVYSFTTVLPIHQRLNDAKAAGKSTNCFKQRRDGKGEGKKRKGWA